MLLPVRSGGSGGRRRSMPAMPAGALMRSSRPGISEAGGAVVPSGAPAMKKAEAYGLAVGAATGLQAGRAGGRNGRVSL